MYLVFFSEIPRSGSCTNVNPEGTIGLHPEETRGMVYKTAGGIVVVIARSTPVRQLPAHLLAGLMWTY